MKILISVLTLLLISLATSIAQDTAWEDYVLHFTVKDKTLEDGVWKVRAETDRKEIVLQANTVGTLLPLFKKGQYDGTEQIGQVHVVGEGISNHVQITVPDSPGMEDLLEGQDMALVVSAKWLKQVVPDYGKFHDIQRFSIGLMDVYGEKDLIWDTERTGNWERNVLDAMREEAAFVAAEMAKQMDDPMVEEGRFKGKTVFAAMQQAKIWDVRSFIRFMAEHPVKYMGRDWKFSEVFATWIHSGTPTTRSDGEDLMECAHSEEGFKHYFQHETSERVLLMLEYVKDNVGGYIEAGDYKKVENMLSNAERFLADYDGFAIFSFWMEYYRGKYMDGLGDNGLALPHYEKAYRGMKELEDKAGRIIAGSALVKCYNSTDDKKHWKTSIKILDEEIKLAEYAKEDEKLNSIVAMLYGDMADAYLKLGKPQKALSACETGLPYTQQGDANSKKRKSILYFRMSATYEALGESGLAKEYEDKAVVTYKEYETALEEMKYL